MEKYLKPDKFNATPDSPTASKEFTHWLTTFENFIGASAQPLTDADKLKVLINFLSYSVYELITECRTYDNAIKTLKGMYVKPKSELFARHLLAIRKQQQGEDVDQYLLALKMLGKDCNFKSVSAEEHKEQYIRDSFINGLLSSQIRQHILEETKTLSLEEVIQRAQALEVTQKQEDGSSYGTNGLTCAVSSVYIKEEERSQAYDDGLNHVKQEKEVLVRDEDGLIHVQQEELFEPGEGEMVPTREEVLRNKRIQAKLRRERIKNDPVLWRIEQEKQRIQYARKKEKKQVKLVAEMTAHEHRLKKKVWQKNSRRHYNKKKSSMYETTVSADADSTCNSLTFNLRQQDSSNELPH